MKKHLKPISRKTKQASQSLTGVASLTTHIFLSNRSSMNTKFNNNKCQTIFERAKLHCQSSIRSIVEDLIPGGIIIGNEYVVRNPKRDDRNPGSFKVSIITGEWFDFATNEGGGLIDLCAYVKGISPYLAAQHLLYEYNTMVYKNQNSHNNPPKVPKVDNQAVLKIWQKCLSANNSLVETYLRTRGYEGAIPENIKYHPNLYHAETKYHWPAMVCAVHVWFEKELIAIHRTFLNRLGNGKADITPNKMMLGSVKGGAVMLSPPGKKLIIAEGIETAMSIYFSTGIPTWAALSTSGMINIIVPPLSITEEIIVAADNDIAGEKAATELALRLHKSGYKVSISMPSEEGLDFNDLLMRTK
jgi:hypothetical protein